MKLRFIPAVLAAMGLFALVPLASCVVDRAKLVVFSTNAVKSSVEKLLPQAENTVGGRIAVEFSSAGTLKERIAAGETFDVAILTREAMDEMVS